MKTRKIKIKFWVDAAVYATLVLMSYQFLYPALRMLTTALMAPEDIINPAVNWIPRSWTFGNIRVAAAVLDLKKTLFNSLWYSGLLAAAQTLVSAMTGFAFARYEFKFKRFWFVMVIVSFILPAPVMLISRTMLFVSIQESTGVSMIGTPIPQVSMALLGQGVYSAVLILIFYNFIRMIPRALDEAATIDGASARQIFYHIILKMSLTTILIVFLFSFVWNWNETFVTGAFLRDKIPLLPSRLNMFDSIFASYGGQARGSTQSRLNEAYKMSATFLSILPLFLIYLLVQRQFIKGIESAGITGE
ncbi:MAG: carbohydrate ABC transporter permease [Treponema sp.]|jgi:multiple sugar transport system permease protein|nr:carbohydrate ABC transporter permease [Treponema sp.]